ncbi:MAG: hypothetical protein J6B09_06625 [Clostridia bacterium]|nr:hypothetical protein [Clostridia bacterium]
MIRLDMRDGVSCKSCGHYEICSAECHDIDTEAIDCGWYKPSDEQAVPCELCEHFEKINGKQIYGLCKHVGIEFKPFGIDTRRFSCTESVPKCQTFAKKR